MDDKPQLIDDPLLRDLPEEDGQRRLGPCLLRQKIGRGGAGNVYLGFHGNLGIDVAVKCLKRSVVEEDERVVARFRNEARVAATLNHPNLIRVYDVGEDVGLHFMIMEFASGETLKARVKREGPLPVAEAVRLVAASARGLAAAHEQGIVHRDVKPDNILLTDQGEVKVLDLGIAKVLEGDETRTITRLLVGTPQYMSPEQWDDSRSVTQATDVYGLGCTLWYLLAGKAPFRSGTPMEIMKRVCLKAFPDISTVRGDIPFPLLAILNDSVARNPLERYQDAAEMGRALEEFLETPVGRKARAAPAFTPDDGTDSEELTPQQSDSFGYEMAYKQVPAPQNDNSSALRVISSRRKHRERPTEQPSLRNAIVTGATLAFVAALGIGIWIGGSSDEEPRAEQPAPSSESAQTPTVLPASLKTVVFENDPLTQDGLRAVPRGSGTLKITLDRDVDPGDFTLKHGSRIVSLRAGSRPGELLADLTLGRSGRQALLFGRDDRVLHRSSLVLDREPPQVTVRHLIRDVEITPGNIFSVAPRARIAVELKDATALRWATQEVEVHNLKETGNPVTAARETLTRFFEVPPRGRAQLHITAVDAAGNRAAPLVFLFRVDSRSGVKELVLDGNSVALAKPIAGVGEPKGKAVTREGLSEIRVTTESAAGALRLLPGNESSSSVRITPTGTRGTTQIFTVAWGVDAGGVGTKILQILDGESLGLVEVTVDREPPAVSIRGARNGAVTADANGSITLILQDRGGIDRSSLEIHGGSEVGESLATEGLAIRVRPANLPGDVEVLVKDRAGNQTRHTVRARR